MSQITYDKVAMTALFEALNTEGSSIAREIQAIEDAKNNLLAALDSENAAAGIAKGHTALAQELDDTKVLLNQLAANVESALNRALGTDQKIGDGFAAFA